ncbi:hypothetical protein [Streptomyces triticagri]|uniref:hypothetical protein n=1 Tax=Streptomyces triticagri TaxID=2293568 RepID=UPI001313EB16|nr:hypothetical protein [Streptomyces triticagri]
MIWTVTVCADAEYVYRVDAHWAATESDVVAFVKAQHRAHRRPVPESISAARSHR